MQKKIAVWAKSVFMLAIVCATIFYSCKRNDVDQFPENKVESGQLQANQLISYNQFLKEIKGWNDQEYFQHFRKAATNQRTSDSRDDSILVVRPTPTTDSVRRISMNGHTTYTIVINPVTPTTSTFHNIVVDSSEAGVKTYLLTYGPDKNWVQDYRRNRKADFYGKVIMSDYPPLIREEPNGRTSLVPICTSVMVLSQIVEHLCCHNQQAHTCNCSAGSKYYIEYLYSQVTTCIDVDIPVFGGEPGGGNGSGNGGGTVPNPGGGYDPCDNGGLRTFTNPCDPTNPPTPDPEMPYTEPNSLVSDLLIHAASKNVFFTTAEIPFLNQLNADLITRIKNLISKFGSQVKNDIGNLHKTITGDNLTVGEIELLSSLGINLPAQYIARLVYAANAYAAQTSTALKFNTCASICASCKGNAFKHALFLIFNSAVFGYEYGVSLAAAHEEGKSGDATLMDKKNNAAGAKIFEQYDKSGTASQWIDRVKSATDQGLHGMACIINGAVVTSKNAPSLCQ